ncbi:MAG: secondary thiamine-phosphate synthase enzyme YjbQ [Chloroflexi bacterium]|nr:secondary thiamine-phosphate synthase enzyme YjbQ [Chloroflexota bacterium]
MVAKGSIRVPTKANVELVDITDELSEELKASGIRTGVMLVYVPHTTAALLVNENETGLVADLTQAVQAIVDWRAPYRHNHVDNNAPSHITGAILGPSVSLPVTDGKLALGTWQSVFLIELDGPRSRRVVFAVTGE